jgi:hypothetical protein
VRLSQCRFNHSYFLAANFSRQWADMALRTLQQAPGTTAPSTMSRALIILLAPAVWVLSIALAAARGAAAVASTVAVLPLRLLIGALQLADALICEALALLQGRPRHKTQARAAHAALCHGSKGLQARAHRCAVLCAFLFTEAFDALLRAGLQLRADHIISAAGNKGASASAPGAAHGAAQHRMPLHEKGRGSNHLPTDSSFLTQPPAHHTHNCALCTQLLQSELDGAKMERSKVQVRNMEVSACVRCVCCFCCCRRGGGSQGDTGGCHRRVSLTCTSTHAHAHTHMHAAALTCVTC